MCSYVIMSMEENVSLFIALRYPVNDVKKNVVKKLFLTFHDKIAKYYFVSLFKFFV